MLVNSNMGEQIAEKDGTRREEEREEDEMYDDTTVTEGKPLVAGNGSLSHGDSTPKRRDTITRTETNTTHGEMSDSNGVLRNRRKQQPSDDEVSLESIEDYIPTPPDGGWGWVIVLASAAGNMIVDGIGYGFGVFLVPLVKAFGATKSEVSMVGSLLCGTYLFVGPIVSAITNKYGCRAVVIAGSLLATVSFILASLSTSITMLILTYGVLGGLGLGMMYLPCIVSVGHYFEKKRAFATGLAVCGSGVGTFVYPPFAEYLLSQLNWSGALLIISAIIFNGCVCGALMRPLKVEPAPDRKAKDTESGPREKNLLDRIKESANIKNRSVSECSPGRRVSASPSTIQERVLEAKLERENRLQDNDSELGSLPSVAFVKEHRKYSEPRRQKMSICSTTDSTVSETAGHTELNVGQPLTTQMTIEEESSLFPNNHEMGDQGKSLDSVRGSNETSPGHSEYVTAPVTPTSTPLRDIPETTVLGGPSQDEMESNDRKTSKAHNQINGIIHSSPSVSIAAAATSSTSGTATSTNTARTSRNTSIGSEHAPLLEVPDASIALGFSKKQSPGFRGSRTNMTHLASAHSLHVSKKDLARPLYRKDIFYSGSVLNIPEFQSQPDMKSYITSITAIPGESSAKGGHSDSNKCVNKCCGFLPRSVRDVLGEMVDLSLLKDVSFMLICLGNILTFLGFFIPFMFLVDTAIELGITPENAAYLVSIIGIANTVGRVAVGKLADLRILDSLVITYLSIFLCGTVTALVPFCNNYVLLAIDAGLFGLGVAAFVSLSSIIICDRLGLDKLNNGFGLLSMTRGVGSMVGPPLAGAMFDSTGSYDLSFFIGGMLMFAGAGCLVLLHLPCLRPKHAANTLVVEDVTELKNDDGELAQEMGSLPQVLTLEEAMSSIKNL